MRQPSGQLSDKQDTYIPALDGLRCLSVFTVIIYHICPWRFPGGFLGVDVFFVISGYLITSILSNELARFGDISFSRFYIRRCLRLMPALWVLVVAYGIYGFVTSTDFFSILVPI